MPRSPAVQDRVRQLKVIEPLAVAAPESMETENAALWLGPSVNGKLGPDTVKPLPDVLEL